MKKYCVIGEKLGHTLSPEIHSMFFAITGDKGEYGKRELTRSEITDCRAFLRGYDGVNVTIPYKIDVMASLDEISDEAKHIGAVNTVKNRNGKLIGFNSDPFGFGDMLLSRGIDPEGRNVTVLGYGGAAKSVVYYLLSKNANVTVVCRNPENTTVNGVRVIGYDKLRQECGQSEGGYLLVNCTSLGMFPNTESSAVGEDVINAFEAVADIVYNPSFTCFLRRGAKLGKRCVGGFYMLVAQAMKSQSIWREKDVDKRVTDTIFNALSLANAIKNGQNIYLTGLMSCGKTTLGKALAKELGAEFVDADEYVCKMTGMTVPEMFGRGEAFFREMESRALLELSTKKGLVVATGGGVVLSDYNVDIMRLSGAVIYIKRDVEKIIQSVNCDNRPLLKEGAQKLTNIFEQRKTRYENSATVVCENNGDEKSGLANLLKILSPDKEI